jgi:DNA-binding PadR family transcriptional regulator
MSEGGRGRHRPGGHRHRPGGPRGDFAFGPGFPFGGPPFRHGRKARRGDVRAALLTLLDEEPRNGYGLMQEIERRSEGAWRPSPGAVYPALQQLEDEGFVRVVPAEGESGRRYELTDAGRAHVEENRDKLGAPWEAFTREVGDDMRATAMLIKDVALAAAQVLRAGDETQVEEARKVLTEARRALYLILAGSEEEASDDDD